MFTDHENIGFDALFESGTYIRRYGEKYGFFFFFFLFSWRKLICILCKLYYLFYFENVSIMFTDHENIGFDALFV